VCCPSTTLGWLVTKMESRAETRLALEKEKEMRQVRIRKAGKIMGPVLSAMLASLLFVGPANAAVVRRSYRAAGDCMMNVALDMSGRSVRAGAFVNCSQWHPSLQVHAHLQYYDPNYTNPVEGNHWKNVTIKVWGPYSGKGQTSWLWTSYGTGRGCTTWRAETQISQTNSLPTNAEWVATAPLTIC